MGPARRQSGPRGRPGVPLIWGGVHPSLLPLETAAHPLVDFVVWGEGEPALVDLLDALRHEREPKGLGAVTFMDAHGEMHHGPPRPFMRLDETLIPDYDLVDIGDYITTQTLGVRDLAVTTSRGCPSRCSFCYNLAFANRRWRAQPRGGGGGARGDDRPPLRDQRHPGQGR
ncbi:MAG: hypothetical protein M5R36_15920 [Deltaproteobacteria bacterium]|nr:hypothetical protein [Deltaproteobacteria bacterium]